MTTNEFAGVSLFFEKSFAAFLHLLCDKNVRHLRKSTFLTIWESLIKVALNLVVG